MSKTIRNVFLIVFAVLLLMALAGCNEEKSDSGAPLQITTLKSMPSAYLNEPFDLREVLTIEKGVTYSATACYVEYTYQEATKDYAFREDILPVEDLCFTPTTLNETAVTITAERGNQTAQKCAQAEKTHCQSEVEG